jgi:molybdopterin molybdotransferase
VAPALLPVSDALARILDGASLLGNEHIPIAEAAGRTLAQSVNATRTQPPFPSSAMDGYAVRAEDAKPGARLKLVGESAAGHVFAGVLGAGQTVRIFTGGAVPPGADAILVQENATPDGDMIVVNTPATSGQFVRPEGLDFKTGQTLLENGAVLSARALGLCAATGFAMLNVARKPRVAILGTGDELVPPGTELGPAQISASNGVAIAALVHAHGGEAIDLGIAFDDVEAIRDGAQRARDQNADILVTTGGASVGERDLVRQALGEEGLALDFWRIAMRPGRPMMAGSLGAMRMLGFPGNPVSAHVCAFLFLVPLIRALLGQSDVHHLIEEARYGAALPANDHREDYLRAIFKDGVATPAQRQDSSMMKILAEADCLIVRAANDPPKNAGDPCKIIRFGPNS